MYDFRKIDDETLAALVKRAEEQLAAKEADVVSMKLWLEALRREQGSRIQARELA